MQRQIARELAEHLVEQRQRFVGERVGRLGCGREDTGGVERRCWNAPDCREAGVQVAEAASGDEALDRYASVARAQVFEQRVLQGRLGSEAGVSRLTLDGDRASCGIAQASGTQAGARTHHRLAEPR